MAESSAAITSSPLAGVNAFRHAVNDRRTSAADTGTGSCARQLASQDGSGYRFGPVALGKRSSFPFKQIAVSFMPVHP
jgi:hypothetical protein